MGGKQQGNTTVEEVSAEEEEKKKEQKELSSSGKVYTLERWHPSSLKDGAVCGYVLNDIDPEYQLNPMEDGFFHRIHLDRTVNFHDLQEGSVVSTIATKKRSSLIRLGARQRTEEEQQPIKSKCPEVHEYRLLAIARYKAPTTFPPSTTAVSLDPTRQDLS